MRKKRIDRIGLYIDSLPRFFTGMLMLPPFLLVEGLVPKVLLGGFFALLAVLAGKRIRWGYFLILILSVTFFHLLSPWGRVLMEIGPVLVTSGALESGLIRGITLAGMVFLSVAAVRPELEFPGRFGGLLGRTFYYFDIILEGGGKKLSRKNFFTSLDELLLERFNPELDQFGGKESIVILSPGKGKTLRGWFSAAAVLVVPWGLWLWTLLGEPFTG